MAARVESLVTQEPQKASAGKERPFRCPERWERRETEDSLLKEKGLTVREIPQSHTA